LVHAKFEMTLSTAIMSKNAPEDRTFVAMLMFEGLFHKIRGTNHYGARTDVTLEIKFELPTVVIS